MSPTRLETHKEHPTIIPKEYGDDDWALNFYNDGTKTC